MFGELKKAFDSKRDAISGYAKLIVSLRATAKQSQSVAIASFHFVPLAMTNVQLILPKYLLLVAGDKSGGSESRFYKQLIKTADDRFEAHLAQIINKKDEK